MKVLRWGSASLLIAVVMALSACSKATAPQTSAPAGYKVISDAENGYAIAVPSSWEQIRLTTDLDIFDRGANRLRLRNPKLASAVNLARVIAGSGGKMMAVDPEGITSANLTIDKAQDENLDAVLAKITAQLTKDGATELASERTTVAGSPGARLSFRFPVQNDEGPTPTDETQYMTLRDGKVYILTVMAAGPETASAIAASLRLR